ncbi:hypothetical protein PR202_ga10460 [Eleusine coracana subsp. coracana]|uniref:Uncharacterized protein n=1 Tax=Eleusine coracana subsp. coracana TaxID=191504 RepID=A0AAV5C6U4_ELECO|nr:hypothetical protein PR202_ga10460 [Eleusine coracana subsp. coracana]
MPRQHRQPGRGGEASGKAVWDTGSSLYDSYELAAVRRLIDRRLLAGVRPLPDEPPPPPAPAEWQRDESKQQQVVVVSGARRTGRKKVTTLRALFRAVVSWAIRLKPKQAHACVLPQGGAVVEPVVSSPGKVKV